MNAICRRSIRRVFWRFAAAVYEQAGMPADDARLAADTLVQADLWGHQSHGVMRLSWYVARLRAGVMQAVPKPRLVVDAGRWR